MNSLGCDSRFADGLGLGGVRPDVGDRAVEQGQQLLDASASQLVQRDVRSSAGQGWVCLQVRDAQRPQLGDQPLADGSLVVRGRGAHLLDPDLQYRMLPTRTGVQGQHAAEPDLARPESAYIMTYG